MGPSESDKKKGGYVCGMPANSEAQLNNPTDGWCQNPRGVGGYVIPTALTEHQFTWVTTGESVADADTTFCVT